MKKFFVSVGLAAAGAASVHAAYSPDSSDNSKIWTLSGTLRGFYDDNYLTTPKKTGSYGFEASPTFSLNAPFSQTEIGVRYIYGLYYYQTREQDGQNPIDQSHESFFWPKGQSKFVQLIHNCAPDDIDPLPVAIIGSKCKRRHGCLVLFFIDIFACFVKNCSICSKNGSVSTKTDVSNQRANISTFSEPAGAAPPT